MSDPGSEPRVSRWRSASPTRRFVEDQSGASDGSACLDESVVISGQDDRLLGCVHHAHAARVRHAGAVGLSAISATIASPENCLLCPDGRACLLDFAMLRELDSGSLEGERAIMQGLAAG